MESDLEVEIDFGYTLRRFMVTYQDREVDVPAYQLASHQDRWQACIMAAVTSMARERGVDRDEFWQDKIVPIIDRATQEYDSGVLNETAEILTLVWKFSAHRWIGADGEHRV